MWHTPHRERDHKPASSTRSYGRTHPCSREAPIMQTETECVPLPICSSRSRFPRETSLRDTNTIETRFASFVVRSGTLTPVAADCMQFINFMRPLHVCCVRSALGFAGIFDFGTVRTEKFVAKSTFASGNGFRPGRCVKLIWLSAEYAFVSMFSMLFGFLFFVRTVIKPTHNSLPCTSSRGRKRGLCSGNRDFLMVRNTQD